MTKRTWGAVAALLLAASITSQTAEPTAADLAASLQRKYDGIHDFSADFTHRYRGGVLKKELSEKGRVLVKKPGKMRWEYTAPEAKTFVSDGTRIYSYIPQDKQVLVSKVPADNVATTPSLFLAGKGNLTRDFTPSLVDAPENSPAGVRALKLVPRKPQPDYDWLILLVDPTTLALKGLVTSDSQGGTSSLAFQNLKENVGLADKEFVFNVPRGVEIINDAGR
jgi:outer membrane lipoprotein carrier protein